MEFFVESIRSSTSADVRIAFHLLTDAESFHVLETRQAKPSLELLVALRLGGNPDSA
jgi:hypothetical protein